MALNHLMHPRNPYKNPIDFTQLFESYPEFQASYEKGNALEWSRLLTTILLKRDYGLDVRFPKESLNPVLPLRFNYLLWIQDLITLNNLECNDEYKIHGCDIGVGSSCILSILSASHFQYSMIGFENSEINYEAAHENIKRNQKLLQHRVELKKQKISFENIKTLFSVCNPPFYNEDRKENSEIGTSFEMTTPGGEVSFVYNLLEESLRFPRSVKIFTSLIGIKSSLKGLKTMFRRHSVRFNITEFCQGRTMRWGIAWTHFEEIKLPNYSFLKVHRNKIKMEKPVVLHLSSFSKTSLETLKLILSEIHIVLLDSNSRLERRFEYQREGTFITYYRGWKYSRKRRRAGGKLNEEKFSEIQLQFKLIATDKNIEMKFQNGATGRDGLVQLATYLKNKLEP